MSLSEYTHEHFHSLPTIEQAGARFVSIDGQQLVHGLLRDLFVNRGMDSTFGLCLMHRHAELETTERLVHYHETASPWKDFTGLPVKPVMWSTSTDGSIRPTEFRYSSQQELVFDEKITSFIEEFNSLAGRNDASGLFGLVEHPGDHFETTCEITQGRTNINLLLADVCFLVFVMFFSNIHSV